MSLLRNDAELALDEVTEACKAAADHYHSLRLASHLPALAAFLAGWEEKRRTFAALLEEEIRRMGNLPSTPDADREALEHLAVRIRRAVARDEAIPFLDSSLRLEEDLGRAVQTALTQPLPPSTIDLLRRLASSVAEAERSLSQARFDDPPDSDGRGHGAGEPPRH